MSATSELMSAATPTTVDETASSNATSTRPRGWRVQLKSALRQQGLGAQLQMLQPSVRSPVQLLEEGEAGSALLPLEEPPAPDGEGELPLLDGASKADDQIDGAGVTDAKDEQGGDDEKSDQAEQGSGEDQGSPVGMVPDKLREGEAGQADQLRRDYASGIIVALTIPKAHQSEPEAIQKAKDGKVGEFGSVDFKAFAFEFCEAHTGQADTWWAKARSEDSEIGPVYTEEGENNRKKIARYMVSNDSVKDEMRKAMLADSNFTERIGKLSYGNNDYIPEEAEEWAEANGAVKGDEGSIVIPGAMYYDEPEKISEKVSATCELVRSILANNPPPNVDPAVVADYDNAVSKVVALTISAHGDGNYLGGDGDAKSTRMGSGKVDDLVKDMAGDLASDVRVRLFACSTAKTDDGMADAWRDALNEQEKYEGVVIGHEDAGNTQKNDDTRFFHADDTESVKDWTYHDVFDPDGYFEQEYARLDVASLATHEKVVDEETEDFLPAGLDELMMAFFCREGWLGDVSTREAMVKSVRAAWEKQYASLSDVEPKVIKYAKHRKKKKNPRELNG